MSAVMNSDLLLHYAKVPQIYEFCILIKLWAKRQNVINLQHPMKGLSSYMIILMCIYYLMDSGQIDFL
jgi:DNA polymerase sigma